MNIDTNEDLGYLIQNSKQVTEHELGWDTSEQLNTLSDQQYLNKLENYCRVDKGTETTNNYNIRPSFASPR